MKRILILTLALASALAGHAQADSTACADSNLLGPRQLRIDFGLSASATLYADGNDGSPYYSQYGFGLHLPLMAHFDLNPHWTLAAGLQYDFVWSPLYYRVESVDWGNGLDFPTVPASGTQHAHAFHGYLGLPLKVSWIPFSHHPNYLSLTLDVHPAYAVSRHITLTNSTIARSGDQANLSSDEDEVRGECLLPWKLEVGLTVATSRLGLIHGLRFFGNLLPTYKDVVTGEKIYLFGMSIYL